VIGLLWFVRAILVSPFRSKARLEAEIATLQQQLIVLQRKRGPSNRYKPQERRFAARQLAAL
jgi:hypothetical protein